MQIWNFIKFVWATTVFRYYIKPLNVKCHSYASMWVFLLLYWILRFWDYSQHCLISKFYERLSLEFSRSQSHINTSYQQDQVALQYAESVRWAKGKGGTFLLYKIIHPIYLRKCWSHSSKGQVLCYSVTGNKYSLKI